MVGAEPIGQGPVGAVSGNRELPAGSLVFVDTNGKFHFTSPQGVALPTPTTAPTAETGEQASIVALDSGHYLVAQTSTGSSISSPLAQVLDSQFKLVGSTATPAFGIASNFVDGFYLWEYGTSEIKRISAANVEVDSWTLTLPCSLAEGNIGISLNNAFAYLMMCINSGHPSDFRIDVYDLEEDTQVGYLSDDGDFKPANSGIITLRDGHILGVWKVSVGQSPKVYVWNSDLEIQCIIDAPNVDDVIVSICPALDNQSFWWLRWVNGSGDTVRVERIRIKDFDLDVIEGFTKTSGDPIVWKEAGMAVVPVAAASQLVSLNFSNGANIWADDGSSAYTAPHWQNVPGLEYPYLIQQGLKLTISATVNIVGNVTSTPRIRGYNRDGFSYYYDASGFTSTGSSASVYEFSNMEAAVAFPNEVHFHDPFEIQWELSIDGQTWSNLGVSANPVYVCLGNPKTTPITNFTLFRTLVHLACSTTGAATKDQAVSNTWDLFKDLDVTTWDGRQLFYYLPDTSFSNNNPPLLEDVVKFLLVNGTGYCGSWAHMLQNAWTINGVGVDTASNECSYYTTAETYLGSGSYFWVKDWTDLPGSPGEWFYFQSTLFDMKPWPSDGMYGHYDIPFVEVVFENSRTVAGQNSNVYPFDPPDPPQAPQQKVFGNHQFVRYQNSSGVVLYYDPSYGNTYEDAADFQSQAVVGFGDTLEDVPEGDPTLLRAAFV